MKKIIAVCLIGLTLVSCGSTPHRNPSSKKQFDTYKFQQDYEYNYQNKEGVK